ncbi:MAG: VWA domain-containing protein [Pyrinomonadaceae bacterium]
MPDDIKQIRKSLIDMQTRHLKLNSEIFGDFKKNEQRISELNALSRQNLVSACEIMRNNGWLGRAVLKDDAFSALLYILTSAQAPNMQRQVVPVLVAASQKGEMPKPVIADMIDMIRLGSGLPQIFGTQATRRGDVLYVQPLLNDEKVDEWRKTYDLRPLADDIRRLELRYLLPVLKSQRLSAPAGQQSAGSADVKALGIADSDESIRVETKAVNLNVIVQSGKGQPPVSTEFTKDDFAIFEDGVQQDPTFFSAANSPFDMVLVLDFSGSTSDKRSLIKKAAKRFVEYARTSDRIAVVAFATDIKLISDLTSDKDSLCRSIDKINLDGVSPVWDSLKFAYDTVINKDKGHRTAIVFMTDGEDNASKITFADLMEVVRHRDTTVFPIYVNTLEAKESQKDFTGRLGSKLHQSLTMLADESGGQSYKADNLKDLNGIYEQVINDIGKIYTLGYEPKNENHDGGWRTVEVKMPHSPALLAKTRRGYYAK